MNSKETDEVRKRYARRMKDSRLASRYGDSYYNRAIRSEREGIYAKEILRKFGSRKDIRLLEIGAGNGNNLSFFNDHGIPWHHIYANEMLAERLETLNSIQHPIHVIPGNAMNIDETQTYDVIFQSTVFTSILDEEFRKALADKMKRLLAADGMILWYDFIYNNPSNPDVKGVSVSKVKQLFSDAERINIHPVTLAPPLGRRVGRLYHLFNIFTFLRTHIVATIEY